MIYPLTHFDDYLWYLIFIGKQTKKRKHPNTKFLTIFNGRIIDRNLYIMRLRQLLLFLLLSPYLKISNERSENIYLGRMLFFFRKKSVVSAQIDFFADLILI